MQFHSLVGTEHLTNCPVLQWLVSVKSEKASLIQGMVVNTPSGMLSIAAKKINLDR